MLFDSYGLYATCQLTFLLYAVTVTCDMTILWLMSHLCDSMTVIWYFPMLHLSNNLREKKRKEKKY